MKGKKKPDQDPAEIEIENSPDTDKACEAPKEKAEEKKDESSKDPTADLQKELSAEKEKYLRLAAEYDNYRKRSQKEREGLYVDVKSGTISELLPVYDNLERALKQETEDEAFYKGVEMTMNQLREIFGKLGVSEIPAMGEKFDPQLHNAVFHIEDESCGENEIVEQFQAGFKLGDRIIRHSMVKVAN